MLDGERDASPAGDSERRCWPRGQAWDGPHWMVFGETFAAAGGWTSVSRTTMRLGAMGRKGVTNLRSAGVMPHWTSAVGEERARGPRRVGMELAPQPGRDCNPDPEPPMTQPDVQDFVEADEPLFDSRRARNYVHYARGSVRRRRALAIGIFLLVLLTALLGLIALPKSYHVEAKLLAQRNATLSVRSDSSGTDAPTRAASEIVVRHDNLVAMIEATDLMRHYASHMAPAQRLRAAVVGIIQRDWTEHDRLEAMVDLLSKQFHVWTNDGTVTIAIDWPDARMACRLVEYAQNSFLEARHIQEVSSTAESVGILQGHATALRSDVDAAVDTIKEIRKNGGAPSQSRAHGEVARTEPVPASAAPDASRRAEADPELTKLGVTIEAKQRAIDDLDEVRRRRVSELQGRLLEQRAVYTDNHPVIIDLMQTIAALSKESPQVTSLRKDVAALRAELESEDSGVAP